MNQQRRGILGASAGLTLLGAGGVLTAARAAAAEGDWNQALFAAHNVREALRVLGGATAAASDTSAVSWGSTPDIAENGQVVPIALTSSLARTELVVIVIEKNPNPVAAVYEVLAGTDPAFRTNYKLSETSNVHAIIKADGRYYTAAHEIKVTVGGCGG